jgi:hypothetical protein
MAIEEVITLGAVLELPAKKHCQQDLVVPSGDIF